jgi:hypothetical protein
MSKEHKYALDNYSMVSLKEVRELFKKAFMVGAIATKSAKLESLESQAEKIAESFTRKLIN